LFDPLSDILASKQQILACAEQNETGPPSLGWVGLNRLVYGLSTSLFGTAFFYQLEAFSSTGHNAIDDAPSKYQNAFMRRPPDLNFGFTLSIVWTRLKFEYYQLCAQARLLSF